MKREERILQIDRLKKLIERQENQVKHEQIILKNLEQRLEGLRVSELPILMFQIDETLPMPINESDIKYENIYYLPDIDEVKRVIDYKENRYLPNTIDMRGVFQNVGIPRKIWPAEKFEEEVKYSALLMKDIIDEFFLEHEINSWSDIETLLNNLPEYYMIPKYDKKVLTK